MKSYYEQITEEYNKWAERYAEESTDRGIITNEAVAAFMCNAITLSIAKSSNDQLKAHFRTYAVAP